VRPGRDCGIQPRRYIPTENKSMPDSTHQTAQRIVDERVSALLDLQRTLGLRFKESCLLNAKLALREARKHGRVTLRAGTKGGKRRTVPCRPVAITALERAAAIQDGKSMVPNGQYYFKFRRECYEQARLAGIGFHSERHQFANDRYTEITGAPAPVNAGWSRRERLANLSEFLNISEDEARVIDREARLKISIELGHNRIGISNAYLG
ncbi:MAG: integrase, partial [Methylococcaceae bacterium]|nr:integrase [Methylococcaceae bacterium]